MCTKCKPKFKNPIGYVGVFDTPENMKALEDYLIQFNGSEKVVAITAAMMAWNLAHKIVEDTLGGKDE